MKFETSIMSMTSYLAGPVEHSQPVTTADDVRQMVKYHALTGEGAGYCLYPESAAEEQILLDMGAESTHVDAMGQAMAYVLV